jgi:hypothetical protein|tara:strand:+ start:293 stop:2680 length:2388 start_codon:yes stop_codon:yes gene_type:complete
MARISPSDQNQSGKPQPEEGPPKVGGPGLDPRTDPKIVVKAVNPPVTPDQVVGIAEMPAAATLDLPKIQNIKISPVKNKTIQGHLRAIEAKMTATEKLMKDIIKLQKLQIITEKEVFERKRELYQNTFEEYLLDKTVDFGDPDASGDGSKKPKKPGGGFPFFGGGRGRPPGRPPLGSPVPVTPTVPSGNTEETPDDPLVDQPDPGPVSPTPGVELPEREEEPGFQVPNVLDLLKVIPFLFQDLLRNQPLGAAKFEEDFLAGEPGTPSYSPTPPSYFETLASSLNPLKEQPSIGEAIPGFKSFAEMIGQDPKMVSDSLDLAMMFTPAAPQAAIPKIVTNPAVIAMASKSPNIARFLGISPAAAQGGSAAIAKQRLLSPGGLNPKLVDPQAAKISAFRGVSDAQRIQTANMIQAASSRGPLGGYKDPMSRGSVDNIFSQNLFQKGVDFSKYKPLTDVVDYSQYFGNMGLTDDAYRMLMANPNVGGMTPKVRTDFSRQLGTVTDEAADALVDRAAKDPDLLKMDLDEVFKNSNIKEPRPGVFDVTNKASGGVGDVDLYSSKALNYFRGISNKIMPMADGGFMGWFNKGVNTRIPNESTARFGNPLDYFKKNPDPTTLFGDDALQRGQSNKNFKAGKKPSVFGRPDRAFGLDIVDSVKQRRLVTVPASQGGPMSGPTPITRELIKRPIRASAHPLIMLAEMIVNELINPQPTAVYDQITGPNAYYNAPGYKGPMPSQNLENAQSSMMSGNNDQKPEIVPLPPDYIKIPGKKKAPDFVGDNSPDIVMRTSIFTRNQTDLD